MSFFSLSFSLGRCRGWHQDSGVGDTEGWMVAKLWSELFRGRGGRRSCLSGRWSAGRKVGGCFAVGGRKSGGADGVRTGRVGRSGEGWASELLSELLKGRKAS